MNIERESDLDLLARWREGDRDAGNELFERHFESVYCFFVHKVGPEAPDLVQRTFLACVEARDRFRGASSFRTFLFAIAKNELLGYFRQRQRAQFDSGITSVSQLATSPSTALVRRFEHRLLLEALRSIPLDLQIALELHYWEKLSATEIAEILDIPTGTAKSKIRRAREALIERIRILESDPGRLATTLANLDAWATALRRALVSDEPDED